MDSNDEASPDSSMVLGASVEQSVLHLSMMKSPNTLRHESATVLQLPKYMRLSFGRDSADVRDLNVRNAETALEGAKLPDPDPSTDPRLQAMLLATHEAHIREAVSQNILRGCPSLRSQPGQENDTPSLRSPRTPVVSLPGTPSLSHQPSPRIGGTTPIGLISRPSMPQMPQLPLLPPRMASVSSASPPPRMVINGQVRSDTPTQVRAQAMSSHSCIVPPAGSSAVVGTPGASMHQSRSVSQLPQAPAPAPVAAHARTEEVVPTSAPVAQAAHGNDSSQAASLGRSNSAPSMQEPVQRRGPPSRNLSRPLQDVAVPAWAATVAPPPTGVPAWAAPAGPQFNQGSVGSSSSTTAAALRQPLSHAMFASPRFASGQPLPLFMQQDFSPSQHSPASASMPLVAAGLIVTPPSRFREISPDRGRSLSIQRVRSSSRAVSPVRMSSPARILSPHQSFVPGSPQGSFIPGSPQGSFVPGPRRSMSPPRQSVTLSRQSTQHSMDGQLLQAGVAISPRSSFSGPVSAASVTLAGQLSPQFAGAGSMQVTDWSRVPSPSRPSMPARIRSPSPTRCLSPSQGVVRSASSRQGLVSLPGKACSPSSQSAWSYGYRDARDAARLLAGDDSSKQRKTASSKQVVPKWNSSRVLVQSQSSAATTTRASTETITTEQRPNTPRGRCTRTISQPIPQTTVAQTAARVLKSTSSTTSLGSRKSSKEVPKSSQATILWKSAPAKAVEKSSSKPACIDGPRTPVKTTPSFTDSSSKMATSTVLKNTPEISPVEAVPISPDDTLPDPGASPVPNWCMMPADVTVVDAQWLS